MLFVELRFLLFFLVVFAITWGLKSNRGRKLWLLICSYAFYAAWDWRFLSLILVSTLVDYTVGIKLAAPGSNKKGWLRLSLLVNLGLLGYFKYTNFFLQSAADLIQLVGFEPNIPVLEIILPVGISFYTFQTLSYSVDVYYGRLEPTRDLLDLSLFVAFFPQLVAGPIVRAVDFMYQLQTPRQLKQVDIRGALLLFWCGFVKKACISDNVSIYVDQFNADPSAYNLLGAWTGVLYYSIQIYCDFSGYSDMAIASAALLGYRLRLNFYFPYFSPNITDFWRRWHVSMSSWLRDYLYIPLGGNRGGKFFVYRNLTITLVLCGLWHGAAWHFVIFGAIHALALALRREFDRNVPAWRKFRKQPTARRWLEHLVGPLMTFYFFATTLVIFRGGELENIGIALRSVVLLDAPGQLDFGPTVYWLFPGAGGRALRRVSTLDLRLVGPIAQLGLRHGLRTPRRRDTAVHRARRATVPVLPVLIPTR